VRKTVTVIFCDVSGSTELGERLDAEAIRRVMSRYFESMTEAIERHGGTVEKFIGDAVMAVFGIPVTHEDDALRAVRAAADMRNALADLNKELERDQGATLACRIGVNTGEVVAGDASLRQALVTGDTVNIAARLEQAAIPDEVLLADTTLRLVRDAVVTDPVEPVVAHGKAERLVAHRLIDVHPGTPGTSRRLDSPLVGRERQLAQIHQAFEEVVAENICYLFTVLGTPGVGKSRLVQEALAEIGDNATILRGRCLSYGEGITYWPLSEVVRQVLGQERMDQTEDLLKAIAAVIPNDPSADPVAARVAQLIGAVSEISAPAEEMGWAVRRFFEGLARSMPVVVVFDDLHWAEARFLELIDQISAWSRDAPILLICLARPELLELRPDWGGGKLHATTATLDSMSPTEAERLVENLVGPHALDSSARTRILSVAEGNPLFVEETLSMLVDEAVLRRDDGRWVSVRPIDEVTVPPSIQALLAARLDRLDEAARATLGRASVIGQVFYLSAVEALSPDPEHHSVVGDLKRLVRRDLIRPETSDIEGEDAFRFHHGLLRDAAYQMLRKEARADLHERFAAWLEERGDPLLETDEFVGYHLERAYAFRRELGPEGEASRALAVRAADRLSAAGLRARDRSDLFAAEKLFGRAAALWDPSDARRLVDLIGLGEAFWFDNSASEAAAAFEAALQAARAAKDERGEAHAVMGGAAARALMEPEAAYGEYGELAALTASLIPRFEAWGDDRGLAMAYSLRGDIHLFACRFESARENYQRAAVHGQAGGDGSFERTGWLNAGAAGIFGPTKVEQILTDADALDAEAERIPALAKIASLIRADAAALVGHFEEARMRNEEARAAERELRGYEESFSLEQAWRIEFFAEAWGDAAGFARRSYDSMRAKGDVGHTSTSAGEWAETCFEQGRIDDARGLAIECREGSASDDAINQVIWRRVEARILSLEGRHEDAERLIAEAIGWIELTDAIVEHTRTHMAHAEVCQRAGSRREARVALGRARGTAARKGASVLVERIDRRLAKA
jgi:class 3 adenylate cyclase